MNRTESFSGEALRVVRGPRSGVAIAVAIHSTARGPAIGGCRIKAYPSWRDGVDDALRLSAAMTTKCALAGLPHGGGKTVAALPPHGWDPARRPELIADIAEAIAALGGRYRTGPDIGSTSEDMAEIHRLAHGWAFCRPEDQGGSGTSSAATARGVLAALQAGVAPGSVSGLRVGLIGFGSVGRLICQALLERGAKVVVTDVDSRLRPVAERLGAVWTTGDLVREPLDVLVPAAAGGVLTVESAAACGASLIVGPANNQLVADDVAIVLRDRGITWIPDVVASAGGIIHAVGREELGMDEAAANAKIDAIGDTAKTVLSRARERDLTTVQAARELAALA
ncbi:Glu/Leu/Phe/Val dehydrogenase dimerization domain-containing protein [Amycolatopsis orientalis]|uniref:Glu/Leu/Phe/Val dehydrogenase dimerization domain-containing protein n=1 Tax=Amycolatopsis orientalis TaxID=31958 RepID=UPI00056750B2|nr:Glu/Leu/Phe/Val dehydrogenase dimerization domain-containing protein [Amycolatopsis orientalis]